MTNQNGAGIMRDLGIIALSVLVAVVLVRTEALEQLFTATRHLSFLNSFISGFFFTSVFTTAPAIAALAEISQIDSRLATSFFGGLGAMCGDFIIFQFVRDRLSTHVFDLLKMKGGMRRFRAHLRNKYFRWLTFLVGGLIIASPIPDEVGLSLLGFSKMRTVWFLVLSFVFNFVGIAIVGTVARAL